MAKPIAVPTVAQLRVWSRGTLDPCRGAATRAMGVLADLLDQSTAASGNVAGGHW